MIRLAKPWITDAEKRAVAEVLDSGWLAEGEKVAEFEESLAKYVGVKHAIVVPNATLGLELAIQALDLKPGRIGVPGFTHWATCCAVRRAGRNGLCFDVSPNGNTTGVDIAEFCDKASVAAVIPVSWGGTALGSGVYLNAANRDIPVIEDCACSLGAINSSGQKAGSVADVSVVSFHPRKIITTGEGGALLTNRDDVAEFARGAKNFQGRYGTNLKMSDINAAVGIIQLRRIEHIIAWRRKCAKLYTSAIDHAGIGSWYRPESDHERRVYQSYCVEVPNRDLVIGYMKAKGFETQIGTYYVVDPNSGVCPVSKLLADRLLTLPINPDITPEDIEQTVWVLGKALEEFR
jgi:dTDP-4-amino-4,6-dideoxygalactose transaminase